MSKWKKNGKKILVLLLATAIIGGMTEHSRVTVAAADAEGEAMETESRPEEEALETQNDPAEKGASDTDCDPAAEGAEAADAENTPVAEGEPGAEGDLPAGDAPNAEEDTDAENTSKVEGEGTPGTEGDKNTEEDISACSGGNVKPDIILQDTDTEQYIVFDVKYKNLKNRGYSRSDRLQVLAYALMYNCENVGIIFPARDGEGNFYYAKNEIQSNEKCPRYYNQLEIAVAPGRPDRVTSVEDASCTQLYGYLEGLFSRETL